MKQETFDGGNGFGDFGNGFGGDGDDYAWSGEEEEERPPRKRRRKQGRTDSIRVCNDPRLNRLTDSKTLVEFTSGPQSCVT